ncbi:MAG: type II secretion system ATPase GspE [Gammaproteobacteria bacterium]|nr:type II secretion system ATPase GspE [Gammaproteobacteria bacterium]
MQKFFLWLQEKSLLTRGELSQAQLLAVQGDEAVAVILVRLGFIGERELAQAYADYSGHPLLEADSYPQEIVGETPLPLRFLKQYHLLPLEQEGSRVSLVMMDPTQEYLLAALRACYGETAEFRFSVGLISDIDSTIERLYGEGRSAMGALVEGLEGGDEEESDVDHLRDLASEAPMIRLVNLILKRAVELGASDLHLEPFAGKLKVRYRVDGVLMESESPPAASTAAVISRIKIMARLNIAEHRLPQDGRISIKIQGKEMDMRISTIPTMFGESVVIRLLDKGKIQLDFTALGIEGDTLQRLYRILEIPHGILLVTGPTGSGKSSTLYTALQRLNTDERKIITVEDPVEYQLEGVNQVQVKAGIGLSFAEALRSIVRQDPDIIMVGEMRDRETAKIAVQSALTGHMVLSTLHTNSAAGGITRLLDMGVEEYLLVSTINAILAQRLVRRLCLHCRQPYAPDPELSQRLDLPQQVALQFYRAVGCEQCGGTGYRGRVAVVELLEMNDALRRLVLQRAGGEEISRQAQSDGMVSLYRDGLSKVIAGVTTIEEVLRVTRESEG